MRWQEQRQIKEMKGEVEEEEMGVLIVENKDIFHVNAQNVKILMTKREKKEHSIMIKILFTRRRNGIMMTIIVSKGISLTKTPEAGVEVGKKEEATEGQKDQDQDQDLLLM